MKPISLHIEIQPDTSLDAPTGGGTPCFLLVPETADTQVGHGQAFMPGAVSLDLQQAGVVLRLDEDDSGIPMEERQWYSCRGAQIRVSRSASGFVEQTSGTPGGESRASQEEAITGRDWSPAELHITGKEGRAGRPYPLDLREGDFIVLGRESPDGRLNIRDEHVSRKHLRIVAREGRHHVEDLGSTWGTKLNGAALPAHNGRVLHHRDQITVGNSTIAYVNVLEALRDPTPLVPINSTNTGAAPAPIVAPRGTSRAWLIFMGSIVVAFMGYVAWCVRGVTQ